MLCIAVRRTRVISQWRTLSVRSAFFTCKVFRVHWCDFKRSGSRVGLRGSPSFATTAIQPAIGGVAGGSVVAGLVALLTRVVDLGGELPVDLACEPCDCAQALSCLGALQTHCARGDQCLMLWSAPQLSMSGRTWRSALNGMARS